MSHLRRLVAAMALFLATSGGALEAQDPRDLTTLSVDDLMNLEVTSVARKGQKVSETPAAVFVITHEDIQRSGATSIPELLRMVPGLDVARVNGNIWAVSARGFNGRYSKKLLVMIDGRTVYSREFSGVNWDVQDTILQDIERIEVIRGPGGTLWGANAVNGIINIITKHAIDTQGTLVSAGGGAAEQTFGLVRHGGTFGHDGYYRTYAKSADRDATTDSPGAHSADGWTDGMVGFRADWTSQRGDTFTAQGDAYRGTSAGTTVLVDREQPFAGPRFNRDRFSGGNIETRWSATQSATSDTSLQVFADYTHRIGQNDEGRLTLDSDFQHHVKVGRENDVIWGLGLQWGDDKTSSANHILDITPAASSGALASAFVQDEIRLSDRLHLTMGTKVQFDSISHLQFQPTIRMLFKATDSQVFWAAATSAVRTPSAFERGGQINVASFPDRAENPGFVVLEGSTSVRPERVETFEIGYRWQPHAALSVDGTAFYNVLRSLSGLGTQQPTVDSAGQTIIPIQFNSSVTGHSDGLELLANYAVAPSWDLALGYSLLNINVVDYQGNRSGPAVGEVASPRHQVQLRSSLRLSRQLELETTAYYVDQVPDIAVPSYLRFDLGATWRPTSRWSVGFFGQNLFQTRHIEFGGLDTLGAVTPVRPSLSGKVTWRF